MSVLNKLSITALSQGLLVRLMLRHSRCPLAIFTYSSSPQIPPRSECTRALGGLLRALSALMSAAMLKLPSC